MVTLIVDFGADSFGADVAVPVESFVFDASAVFPLFVQEANRTMAVKPMSSDFLFRIRVSFKKSI
jgi:hypothetical protein